MPCCWAAGCSNVAGGKTNKTASGDPLPSHEKLSFHMFPFSRPTLLKQWLDNINRPDSYPKKTSVVCSVHFKEDSFMDDLYGRLMLTPKRASRRGRRLKADAVPSQFGHSATDPGRDSSTLGKRQQEHVQQVTTTETGPTPKKKRKITATETRSSTGVVVDVQSPEQEEYGWVTPRKPVAATARSSQSVHTPEATALMVEVVESPHSVSPPLLNVAGKPGMVTPLKYRSIYGTPKRVIKDHSYSRGNKRSISVQTESSFPCSIEKMMDRIIAETSEQKESPETVKVYTSPESSPSPKKETSDTEFVPLPSSSSSSSTDSDEAGKSDHPCDMDKYLVFDSCLKELFHLCKMCGGPVISCSKSTVGSMVSMRVSCHNGHDYVWHSQPVFQKQPLGNILISSAILTSGNTYAKISAFADLLKLKLFSATVYYRIQRENLVPVINDAWEKERIKAVEELKNLDGKLILSGDARCDSPGHNAKYSSYTLMQSDESKTGSRKIVSMKLVQVSEVKNSYAMEPEGLKRCLEQLKEDNLEIDVLATDRHRTVNSIMNKDYKEISHQYDTWHVAKSIVKKLSEKAKKRDCEDLSPWIQSISNHLWWCCSTCDGNAELLKEKWLSILHHISKRHKWPGNQHIHECGHPPLSAAQKKETMWIKRKSKAFEALEAVVKEKNLLSALPKMTKFCHTGDLETFHNMLLKFCPKRQHFSYDVMSARLKLAAIDWNNMKSIQRMDKSGKLATSVVYSKRRKLWIMRNRYSRAPSDHMFKLMKRMHDVFVKKLPLTEIQKPDIPQHVAAIPKPTRSTLAQKFKSRFK